MENTNKPHVFIMFILVIITLSGHAQSNIPNNTEEVKQDTTTLYHIETKDGNTFVGHIVDQDNRVIHFETEGLGIITILKQDIVEMRVISKEKIVEGIFWDDHVQSTRYFWQPNGYGLKKGEGYYQNVWILFNQFSVGVTDHFLIGGGLIPLFLFGGGSTPVWITPKFSIPVKKDKFNLGAGALFATVLGEGINLGIPYATATFGPRDKNLSVGVGYGYADGEWANSPTFSFSALIRTGQKGYFLTENYFISTGDEYIMLLMFGGRRILGRKAGLDFGLVLPLSPNLDTFVAIPWLGITIPFGKPK